MKPGRKIDSFTVCIPCKKHKVKCDKVKPVCGRCRRLNKLCQYNDLIANSTLKKSDASIVAENEVSSNRMSIKDDCNQAATGKITSLSTPFSLTENDTLSNSSILPTLMNDNLVNAHITHTNATGYDLNNLLQLPDTILNLWDISQLMVTCGSTNHLDAPYTLHAIIQYDPFTRLLCSALHGTILNDLQNRINLFSIRQDDSSSMTGNNDRHHGNVPSVNDRNFLGPLPFIEKAMLQWIEKLNDYGQKKLIIDFFDVTYVVEDSLHPNLKNLLQMILKEIHFILPHRDTIDTLLRRYYERIYPMYPYMEIELFEQRLSEIFNTNNNEYVTDIGNLFEFNILNKDVRSKLETVVLFITILSLSLCEYSISKDTILQDDTIFSKLDATDISKQLVMQAKRILSLLDGSQYLNENIICCSLHLFLFDYLNPKNKMIHASHDESLSIKIIYQMAITMGLQYDPTNFKRFSKNGEFDNRVISLKRKIWIGIQSILLQICTIDGSLIPGNDKNLIQFCSKLNKGNRSGINIGYLHSKLRDLQEDDIKIFEIQQDIYKLQLNLNKMMKSLVEDSVQSLSGTIENIQNLINFMDLKFPFEDIDNLRMKMTDPDTSRNQNWRNARLNMERIRLLHIINLNLQIIATILTIYISLMIFFESKSLENYDQNHKLYSYFHYASIEWYLKLYDMLMKVLNGEHHLKDICINKTIIFTMIKLWRTQMNFTLRLSFKSNLMMNLKHDVPEEIGSLLQIFQKQMSHSIQLFSARLQDTYFGAYQSIQMSKYLEYLLKEDKQTEFIRIFWDMMLYGESISPRIKEKVTYKWGQSCDDVDMVKEYLQNPEVLRNLDTTLLQQVYTLMSAASREIPHTNDTRDTPGNSVGTTPDSYATLDRLLHSNLEQFMSAM